MDSRFERVWSDVAQRRADGEAFAHILRSLGIRDLVALLAATPKAEVVAANVVATELLNRFARLRATYALLVGLSVGLVVYVLDGVYSGTWLDVNGGPLAEGIAIFSLAAILLSLVGLFRVQRRGAGNGPTRF